jgi:biopolymer transport protein ExbD
MRLRRKNNLLVEPPASATGDIAFNLIVFFLVCASVQPDSGRKQTIPRAEQTENKEKKNDENIQVELKRTAVLINGDAVRIPEFGARIKVKLDAKRTQEEKIVVVKSGDDVEYAHWIAITSQIEDAGGIITLQLEEERTVTVP